MSLALQLILTVTYTLLTGLDIGFAIDCFKKKRYVGFGMWVSVAITNTIMLVSTVFKY